MTLTMKECGVDDTDGPEVKPRICGVCGVLIGDLEVHTRWHAELPTVDGWPKPTSTRPGS